MKRNIILITLLILNIVLAFPCSIGVASNTITTSNKPILWKSRDISPSTTNSIRYVENMTYNYVAITTPGENLAWMGVNEAGFALANSLSDDLTVDTGTFNNGNLIYSALGLVENLAGFENYLDYLTTSSTLDLELRGNFVAFDADGNTKLYEVNNNNYWVFETNETENPYILRTNHSVNGGGNYGIERLLRSTEIVHDLALNNELSVNNLLVNQIRDISDENSNPFALPWEFGDSTPFYYTDYSICRRNTISAVVIEGVEDGQDPKLTTMWLIMGNPFVSYALPLLPTIRPNLSTINNLSENSPELVNNLWNEDNGYLLNTSRFVNSNNFSLMQTLSDRETESYLMMDSLKSQWANDEISDDTIRSFINQQASSALAFSSELFNNFTPNYNSEVAAISNINLYPNPFYSKLTLEVNSPKSNNAKVKIYNIKGQLVKTLDNVRNGKYQWNGRNNQNERIADGVYLLKYESKDETITKKVVLMK